MLRQTIVGLTALVVAVSAVRSSQFNGQNARPPVYGAGSFNNQRPDQRPGINVISHMQRDIRFLLSLSSELKERLDTAESNLSANSGLEDRLGSAESSITALQLDMTGM